jgi:hypothetical protein
MRTFRRVRGFHVPLNHQSHHLIPVGVFSRKAFEFSFESLRGDGFDVRNFVHNGIFLPSTEAAAIGARMPLHRGPHRHYNDLVACRVASILSDMDATRGRAAARRDAADRLTILAGALRSTLRRRKAFLSLNQRDPFASHVDFSDLDAACDLLWLATK